jgi:hypothetical protein
LRSLAAGLVLGLASGSMAHAQSPCGGMRFNVQTAADESRPYVRLALDGKTGPFLLDFGATASTVARSVWNVSGSEIQLSGFTLPSFSRGTFGLRDNTVSGPLGTVYGVIGTDYLALLTTELHYEEAGDQHVTVSPDPCRAELGSLGFRRISTRGYFSSDPTSLHAGESNVPVIFANLGGIRAAAQIDTGYDDSVFHHTIELNPALFDQVSAAVPLVQVGTVSIRTCAGTNRSVPVYVAPSRGCGLRTRPEASFWPSAASTCSGRSQGHAAALVGWPGLRRRSGPRSCARSAPRCSTPKLMRSGSGLPHGPPLGTVAMSEPIEISRR